MSIEEIERQIAQLQQQKNKLLIEQCLPMKGKFYVKNKKVSPSSVCRVLVPEGEWVPVWSVHNYLPYGADVTSRIIQIPAANLMPKDSFGNQVSIEEALAAVKVLYEKASQKAITQLLHPSAFGTDYTL